MEGKNVNDEICTTAYISLADEDNCKNLGTAEA